MKEHGKLPWRIETGGKKNMSAVVDADGNLICGSLICCQEEETISNHRLIVASVNQGKVDGWNELVNGLRDAPLSFYPALFLEVIRVVAQKKVFRTKEGMLTVAGKQIEKDWPHHFFSQQGTAACKKCGSVVRNAPQHL